MMNQPYEKDHRCPYCGRPVLGVFVPGNEGRYHPACTQPPLALPVVAPWQPPELPDFTPKITCGSVVPLTVGVFGG